jgi:two-component system, OmpR family, phosphate regulon response regulator PhoB
VTPALTVLVVDDDVSLARLVGLALVRAGYVVHIAHTAEDGLRLAQSEHPAAIIVDLRMPFINGTGFLYRLRASPQHRDTPVLVVTGESASDEMRADMAALRAVLRFKPLGMSELITEVSALLGHPPLSASALASAPGHDTPASHAPGK